MRKGRRPLLSTSRLDQANRTSEGSHGVGSDCQQKDPQFIPRLSAPGRTNTG